MLKKIFEYRSALINLTKRNIKTRYGNTIFGYMWAVLTPIAFAVILDFIFTNVIRVGIKDFTLFVLSGLFAWNFFSNSVTESSYAIINSADIVRKFPLPLASIPISVVFSNLLIFIVSLLVILPFFIIKNCSVINYVAILPFATIFLAAFTIGISLILSSTSVYFRDVHHFFSTALIFWFWVTPVFYSTEMVPEKFRGICLANPMTLYTNIYRAVLFDVRLPGFSEFILAFTVSIITLIISGYIFTILEPNLSKRL